ncbi:MAG: DUF4238 domain-containing protein [Bacillota bacterium]
MTQRHHSIPEFYLAGFTPTGCKSDYLWVTDQEKPTQRRSLPNNEACEKGYYGIDAPGVDPNIVEENIARLESSAAPVIRQIESSHQIPSGHDFVVFIKFIALMAARVPVRRSQFTKSINEVSRMIMKIRVADEQRWQSLVQGAKDAGFDPGDVSYTRMKEFIDGDRYRIEVDRNTHVRNMMTAVDTLLPCLDNRKWSLILTSADSGDFICSDSPVWLGWNPPQPPSIWGPGFGLIGTEVVIPLTKSIAASGKFEGSPMVFSVNRESVAALNTRTAEYSERFIYSSDPDFVWLGKGQVVRFGHELLKALADERTSETQAHPDQRIADETP